MTAGFKEMRVIHWIASCLVAVICLAGCSTVQGQQSGTGSGPMAQGDALTLVLDYGGGSPEDAAKLEGRLAACVQQALKDAGRAAKLIPADEFRRTVFPDRDITSAPRSAESLALLLKVPQFRQQIDSLHLRYLITVREDTASRYESKEFESSAGIVVTSTHTKRTDLTARIIDMKRASQPGVVSATAQSTGVYGVVAILPIIVPAVTESTACERLGLEVVKFISSETENGSAEDAP